LNQFPILEFLAIQLVGFSFLQFFSVSQSRISSQVFGNRSPRGFRCQEAVLGANSQSGSPPVGKLGILLAEPGQGKTYMSRYLVSRISEVDKGLVALPRSSDLALVVSD
jgi:hypothetical protein